MENSERNERNSRRASDASYRLGIDIGGTFTDIVLLGGHDGSIRTKKVLSTPDNYSRGVVNGAVSLLDEYGIAKEAVESLVHATTVASNTVLEQRGARTALITTRGFRDVLEMRRLRIPVLYDLQYEKPAPLVPRRYRFEVEERIGPTGKVWRELDEEAIKEIASSLQSANIEALAICLLHSYANPTHEHRIEEIVRSVVENDIYITCSADILPEIREYERMSTAVVNSYLGPIIDRYLVSLAGQLHESQLDIPVEIMQSSGGRMTTSTAIRQPAQLVESGPAAGVIASAHLAALTGYENLISLDMGGTTAKAAILENGKPIKTSEYEIGAGINLSSKLIKGGGYPVKLPIIDLSEIGAGGGSIVSIDEFGVVNVGPLSAGAVPGPVCYDSGGTQPTLTDALLVLGYLNPNYLVGGALEVNLDKARRALDKKVAQPLHKPVMDTAFGVFTLAVATMTRAVNAVTTYRGRDPRDFTLCAFGGNGPVTAAEVARVLHISRVIVPPAPGVFSAMGLLFSETEQELVQTLFISIEELCADELEDAYRSLEEKALATLSAQGYSPDRITFTRLANLRYTGQTYELEVTVPPGDLDIKKIARSFVAEHRHTYGHASPSDPIDLVTIKIVAKVTRESNVPYDPLSIISSQVTDDDRGRHRQAYFGSDHGILEVPVVTRASLGAKWRLGPLLVDEYDSTCLVPPGCLARLDGYGNIEIEINAEK